MKIEMSYLTLRQRCQFPSWSQKKVLFSNAYQWSSTSLHGVTTHVKPPGFKQRNWRIRENLSQAINKLSSLVSEDATIVQLHVFTAFEDSLKTHETWALEINIITSGFTNWELAK